MMTMIDNFTKMPVGTYERAVAICNERATDDLDKQVKLISLLTEQTEEAVLAMPLPLYADFAGRLDFLTKPIPQVSVGALKWIKVGDMKLRVMADARKMTTAQYIDFQTLSSHEEVTIAQLLSCFLIPEGKEYNEGYDIEQLQALLEEGLMITTAVALLGFFVLRSLRSIRHLALSSALMMIATARKDKRKREEIIAKTRTMLQAVEQMWRGLGFGQSMQSARRSGVLGARFSL